MLSRVGILLHKFQDQFSFKQLIHPFSSKVTQQVNDTRLKKKKKSTILAVRTIRDLLDKIGTLPSPRALKMRLGIFLKDVFQFATHVIWDSYSHKTVTLQHVILLSISGVIIFQCQSSVSITINKN